MRVTTLISAGVFIVASAFFMKNENTVTINTTVSQNEPLYETKWSLKKMYTGSGFTDVSTKAFLKFDEIKKSAGGNGSCNSFGSSTTINGNGISFKNIFSTKMYCEEVQKIENAYLNNLSKANRFEIRGSTLALYSDKEVLLEFTAE